MTSIKLLTIVEATTINAVAKIVLEFYRSARELNQKQPDFPLIEGCLVTFDRQREVNSPPNDFVVAARELGVEVEVIPERRRFDLKVIPALRSIVESRGPDIVVTNSVKSHFLMWRSRLWRERPWVAFHHGYTDTDRKMRVYNRLDRWSLPHADRLVTVCHAFAQDLAAATGVPVEKITVQHNAIRPQSRMTNDTLRKRLGIGDDERVILSVGRLSREKAHHDLLAAFKLAREATPELSFKLLVVGDGPERAGLEAAAKSFDGQVIFAGETKDVWAFYAIADVFVLPSHIEGSPNVLLEAMAARLPVVATKVGGVPEIVEDNESALLVRASDPQALAQAITRLLTDKALASYLAANAASLIANRFALENRTLRLIELYAAISNH